MATGELSRYRGTSLYTADDGSARFAAWRSPPYTAEGGGERLYGVTSADLHRPDLISYRAYGTPELWWLVLDYNRIADPFIIEPGDKLRIPSSGAVLRMLRERERVTAIIGDSLPAPGRPLSRPGLVIPYRPPHYVTPYAAGADAAPALPDTVYLHTFVLFGPGTEPATPVHFQLQLGVESTFGDVLLSRMSSVTQEHWSYFDPSAGNGAGGFLDFPVTGLPVLLFGQQVRWKLPAGTASITLHAQYFFRYRSVVNQIEQAWSPPAPVTFA